MLVNNAGITRDGLAMRMKPADWDLVLNINLNGAFRCIQQVLPTMMRSRWGRIINIASVVGQAGSRRPGQLRGVEGGIDRLMTKALAQEMGSRGITVNAVAPGYIATDMTKVLPEEVKAEDPGIQFRSAASGKPGRHRRRREVPGQRGRRLHHRPRPGGQRRHVHVGAVSSGRSRLFGKPTSGGTDHSRVCRLDPWSGYQPFHQRLCGE